MHFFFWIRYPFVLTSLCFAIGNAFASLLSPAVPLFSTFTYFLLLWAIAATGLITFLSLLFYHKTRPQITLWIILPIFFLLGVCHWLLFDERYQNHHLDRLPLDSIHYMTGTVVSDPSFKNHRTHFILEIHGALQNNHWDRCTGNLYVTLADSVPLYPSQYILIKGKPAAVSPPDTPYDFDFQHYLFSKNIHYTAYCRELPKTLGYSSRVMMRLHYHAYCARNFLEHLLRRHLKTKRTLALLSGLLIGKRSEFSPEDRSLFTSSGTIHVLAVSGMHVMLIYQCLVWGLSLLRLSPRSLLFIGCSFVLIWFYIFITGLNPSACRAAFMLSFALIGKALYKPRNTINIFCAVFFIMLLYHPYYLSDAGFLLSFLAVGGLLVSSLYEVSSSSKVFTFLKASSLVSISAQTATFPYSIYLFQQFPVYFLPANLLIVPLTSILLFLTIGLLITLPIPFICDCFAWSIENLSDALFFLLQNIERLPGHLITGISMTLGEMVTLYLLLLAFLLLFLLRKIQWMWAILSLSIILSLQLQYRLIWNFKHLEIYSSRSPSNTRRFLIANGHTVYSTGNIQEPLNTAEKVFLSKHFTRHTILLTDEKQALRMSFSKGEVKLLPVFLPAKKYHRSTPPTMDYQLNYLYIETTNQVLLPRTDSLYLESKKSFYKSIPYELDPY